MTSTVPEKEFREPSPGFSAIMGKWSQRDKETKFADKPFVARIGQSMNTGSGGTATTTQTMSSTLRRVSATADTILTSPIREKKPIMTIDKLGLLRHEHHSPRTPNKNMLSPSELQKKALIDRSSSGDVHKDEMCMAVPPPLLECSEEEDDDDDDEENDKKEKGNTKDETTTTTKASGPKPEGGPFKTIGKVSAQWTNLLRTSTQLVRLKRRIKQKKAKLHNVWADKLDDDETKIFVPPVYDKTSFEKQMIKDAMKSNFVFRKLDKLALDTLVDAFEQVRFEPGEKIIQQGDKGDYFYAIKLGSVDFFVDDVKVGTAKAGKSFGELALLYTCRRAATVRASLSSKLTTVFRIDQKCFRHILKDQTKKSRNTKIKLLHDTTKFETVEKADLKILAAAMEPHIYEKGDIVWPKGDDTTFQPPFCIIQEGELSFTNISIGKRRVKDKTLGRGDYFGEVSIDHTMEPIEEGTVTALSRVLAFTIDPHVFDRDFGGLKKLVNKSNDKRHLSVMKSIKNIENLDEHGLNMLADHVVDITFEAGCPIYEKGHIVVPAVYLVREGKVRLDEKNEEITAGGSFGQEMDKNKKNIGHVKAEVSAIAVERTMCGVLSLGDCPVIFDQHMISKVAERYTPSSGLVLEDLTHHRPLGEGQFGEVFLVSSKKEEKPKGMALKAQAIDCNKRPDTVQAIWDEIKAMQHLKHNLLVSLITSFEDKENIYMLLTLAHGGELWDVIHQENEDGSWVSGIGEQNGKFYAAVVADALAFMHRQKYVYRDLKPENVLIDEMGYPIITDFGFAKYIGDEKTFTFCGTPNYLPPEVISNSGHCFSADNWSLGVLIYELIEGENPFYYEGMDQMALFEAICSEQHYPLQKKASKDANGIIELLLEKNPDKRLGMFRQKDILGHPWFSDLDLTKLRNKEVGAPWIPDPLEL